MDIYHSKEQIGEGSYGRVYKATDKNTNKLVAIKITPLKNEDSIPLTIFREIRALKCLRSNHVVAIENIFLEKQNLFLVLEYCPFDLYGLIRNGFSINNDLYRSFAYQLLTGVKYLHDLGYVHRDLKTSNILITRNGVLKITDFGLTREIQKKMTNKVCTLWYRAPELLLGEDVYGYKVDSWSIGCILLEIKLKKVAFKGNDEFSQIRDIFSKLGTPNENFRWSRAIEQKRFEKKDSWITIIRKNFGEFYDHYSDLDLISNLIQLTPQDRFSVDEILEDKSYIWVTECFPIDCDDAHEFYCKRKPYEERESKL